MISLGVTGHRRLAEVERVSEGIDRALQRISCAFGTPRAVVSCLAEGADRLVAARALVHGVPRLEVVLPLAEDDYVRDFGSPASKQEFHDLLARADLVINAEGTARRPEAYAIAGRALIDHCSVLIALWDGQPSRGFGSTATVVHAARDQGLPLAWIHIGSPDPKTKLPRSLGHEQGAVTVERFPTHERAGSGYTG